MGDMGIEIIPSRLQTMEETGAWTAKPRTKKKKKLELPQEFLCKECGTTDSPEWRKGPCGSKTLCNACGCEYLFLMWIFESVRQVLMVFVFPVRWSKAQKKSCLSQKDVESSQ
jgi:hypothetical protein